ncbi:MAG TPA: amidase family protein [Candidatus Thermoplasmatota archaeon]|nr:amidase family protein [Candidatus Thermoplasmatota archaeon]
MDPVALARERLAAAHDAPKVFLTLCRERALLEAEAARARAAAGLPRGLLDGVPLAWKDLVDLRGTVTTAGSPALQRLRRPAREDAPVAARASGAGLVSIGKTNLTELAYSGLGFNPHFGTPLGPAPQAPPRMPGGSSSGSAVAVALGIVPLAVGTDTAGSLRIPAAFNGIVAFRPSRARHDLTGVTPLARSLDTLGPMATSVADCIALDDCLRTGVPRRREPTPPDTLRLVVDAAVLSDPRVAPAVKINLQRAMDRLAAGQVHVTYRPLATVDATLHLIATLGWLGAPEAYAEYAWLLDTKEAELMDPRVRRRLQAAASSRADHVFRLQRERDRLIPALGDELEGALLVMPTVAHTAPEIAPLERDFDLFTKTNFDTLRLTMVGSYLDLPTVALPTGTDGAGQFTGLQVSAPSGDDERLLRAALTLSQVLGIEAPERSDDNASPG